MNDGGMVVITNFTVSNNIMVFQLGIGGCTFNSVGIVDITNSNILNNSGGGGIWSDGGTTEVNNCNISNNFGVQGGIGSAGNIIINNSILAQNICFGFSNNGTGKIIQSTIANNELEWIIGHFFDVGSGISNSGTLEVTDCAIVDNEGGACDGGGITNAGSLKICNGNIARNTSGFFASGIANVGLLKITNSTNVDGITNSGIISNPFCQGEAGTVELVNTILSNCIAPITSLGNNIIDDTTGCTVALLSSDLTGDPGLGAFTDNGSPGNGLFPLLCSSEAINAGNNNVCLSNPILATDQIGDLRVGICDIGSIEFEPFKNLGQCISTLIKENCSGLHGQRRA